MKYKLAFLGFGNVGRALARLFVSKSVELKERYDIEWQITGVASRRLGWHANPDGFDATKLLSNNQELAAENPSGNDIDAWLKVAQPDVVFETTSLNHETGQPAIGYLSS